MHKFNKDRRDNVRVCVMDATSEAGGAVPGVKIESLPATMVFQAGKLTSCGVVHGFTRNNTQAIEASVRQCTSKGGSAAPLSSAAPGGFGAGQSGAGPKDIAKLGPSEPLSLPQGIDLCSVTAEGVFKAAHARVQSLEAKIHAGKQAGTGQGAMLGNELKAAEMVLPLFWPRFEAYLRIFWEHSCIFCTRSGPLIPLVSFPMAHRMRKVFLHTLGNFGSKKGPARPAAAAPSDCMTWGGQLHPSCRAQSR